MLNAALERAEPFTRTVGPSIGPGKRYRAERPIAREMRHGRSLDLPLEYHDNRPRLSVKGEPS